MGYYICKTCNGTGWKENTPFQSLIHGIGIRWLCRPPVRCPDCDPTFPGRMKPPERVVNPPASPLPPPKRHDQTHAGESVACAMMNVREIARWRQQFGQSTEDRLAALEARIEKLERGRVINTTEGK